MDDVLPAAIAFAGGSVSLSSATDAGLVIGLILIAVGTVLAVAYASRRLGE
ncbi:hypothetical protein [Halobaculum magnesiiphilum]|uniref:Uncharacterized protein n=1 Tax=Halobaculum magnesiiphilum TaxID=1017351 RepID=A0A8T8W9R8_9EURY|nr:hypothetical protein [Halobaculum magnesiiphilum]QZP36571.1 hypothetical protein K6T50_09605 [Halobaculum magnesiiphilum]